jgi:hypothetical protein
MQRSDLVEVPHKVLPPVATSGYAYPVSSLIVHEAASAEGLHVRDHPGIAAHALWLVRFPHVPAAAQRGSRSSEKE